jgi:hypothetical protein
VLKLLKGVLNGEIFPDLLLGPLEEIITQMALMPPNWAVERRW